MFGKDKRLEEVEPLFIENKTNDIGIITAAAIKTSKASGRRYILLTLDMGGADQQVVCAMGRMIYTMYVIRNNLGTTLDDEAANVAYLVGMNCRVRFENIQNVDGQTYCSAYPLSVEKGIGGYSA